MGRFSAIAENLSTSLAAYCSSSASPRNFCCSAFASYRAKVCSHADCALGGDRLAPVAKHSSVTLKANSIKTVAGSQAVGGCLQSAPARRVARNRGTPLSCLDRRFFQKSLAKIPLLFKADVSKQFSPYSSVLIRIGLAFTPEPAESGSFATIPQRLAGNTALDTRCGLQSS